MKLPHTAPAPITQSHCIRLADFLMLAVLLTLLQGVRSSATSLNEFAAMSWTDKYQGTPFSPDGWTLTFQDDFPYDPNLSYLVPETSSIGTWFVPGHSSYGVGNFVKIGDPEFPNTFISLPEGGLRLRAHRSSSGSTTWYPANLTTVNNSGQGFTFRYGYLEMLGQFPVPSASSTHYIAWCSPWLLTQNGFDVPRTNNRAEIDLIEWYAGDNYSDHQTVHLIDTAGVRKSVGHVQAFRPMDLSTSLHLFGIKITPTWTILYIDGHEINRFPTVEEFTYPKYLLLSNAITTTGSADHGETEYNYDIDNVSVWQMPEDIAVDNTDAGQVTISSGWTSSTATPGYLGTDYLHDGGSGKGSRTVKFTPNLPCSGNYKVYTRWTAGSDRATNVPYTIAHSNGSQVVTMNQTVNGGQWNLLGTFNFDEGASGSVTVSNLGTAAGKYVITDAVRFVLQDPWLGSPQLPPPAPLQADATPGDESVTVNWTASPGGPFIDDTASAVTYGGSWTHATDAAYFNNSKSYSSGTGAYAETTFTGTGIRIFVKKDASFGKFDVYLDDMVTPVATVDTFNATPAWQQKAYENLSLPNGTHTIRMVVAGQKNPGSSGYLVAFDYLEALPSTLSYTVKRATSLKGPYATVAGNVSTLSFTDTGLVNGVRYYYVVSATNANGAGSNSIPVDALPLSEIHVIDNKDSGQVVRTGTWTSSTSSPGYYGTDYIHDGNTGSSGGKSVRFTPNLSVAGPYDVSIRWISGQVRASGAPVDIIHAGGTSTVYVDQQIHNGQWISLGQYVFNPGTAGSVLLRNDGCDGYVIADAVRLELAETPVVIMDNLSPGVTLTGTWTESTNSGGYYGTNYIHDGATGKGTKSVQFTPTLSPGTYEVFAYWPSAGTRYNGVPFDINHAGGTQHLFVNQATIANSWVSLGTYAFNGGTGGSVVIFNTGTSNYVIVDAIKFVRQ